MNVTQDMPTEEMIAVLQDRCGYLIAELGDKEHPWENTDREGTRRRAAEELATIEFRLHARINDLRAQNDRMDKAVNENIKLMAKLGQIATNFETLRNSYHRTA